MPLYAKGIKRFKDIAMLIAGNALLAFTVAAFIVPFDFITGGTTGISIFLSHLFPMDTALLVLLLNIILLLLGLIFIGKRLFFSTIASSVLYPVLLALFQRIPGIESLTDNVLLAALFGGSLMGVALGLVMRVGASTGGMDIVVLIMNKYLHCSVSVGVWITDAAVILLQALFSPAESTLYAIIILVTESVLLDRLMLVGLPQIQIFAVSDRYEQIRLELLRELDAGVTLVDIETGALKKKQQGVLCVIPQRKLYHAVTLIQNVDPTVFMTISQIKEAKGRGYTLEQSDVNLNDFFPESNRSPENTDCSPEHGAQSTDEGN